MKNVDSQEGDQEHDRNVMVQDAHMNDQGYDDTVNVPHEFMADDTLIEDSDEEFRKIEERVSAKVLEEKQQLQKQNGVRLARLCH